MSETLVDVIEWRILGAIELVDDVTGTTLRRPFTLTADGVTLARTHTGRYAITAAPGLAAHTRAFDAPPATPAFGAAAVTFGVEDPLGDYLPRLATVPLPRAAHPGANDPPLFEPAVIAMLPAPRRGVAANWAVLRVSVVHTGGTAVPGALIELRGNDVGARLLGRGVSDRRGEALLAVAGLPLNRAGDDETPGADVTTPITQARVGLVADPALPWPVDPDRLARDRATLSTLSLATPVDLTAGGAQHQQVTFDP